MLRVRIAKVKWDESCKERYLDRNGRFKGGPGERTENCIRAVKNCATGVKDPEAFCAYIGRKSPRWPGKSSSRFDILTERVAAFNYALFHGECPTTAAFYADEVERMIVQGTCGCPDS